MTGSFSKWVQLFLQGFKGGRLDLPHNAKLLGEGGSATIYQETLVGEMRATKYPKKVSLCKLTCYYVLATTPTIHSVHSCLEIRVVVPGEAVSWLLQRFSRKA